MKQIASVHLHRSSSCVLYFSSVDERDVKTRGFNVQSDTMRETECRHFTRTTSSKERKYDDSGGAGCVAKSLLVDVFRPQKSTSLCAFYDKFMTVL